MTVQLDVLFEGYVGDRVAGTVSLIRDADLVMFAVARVHNSQSE